MMPAVPAPRHVRVPVDAKLKRGWRYVPARRAFVSGSGQTFAPTGLPSHTRIVAKVPALAEADPATLSRAEKDLRRYFQVILPPGVPAADYVNLVRAWPPVEESHVAPEVSLPTPGPGGPAPSPRRPPSGRR
jgi:hypothetical protein